VSRELDFACKRRGAYFYYNRAAIGLAFAQATAMRIDIAPHKRPRTARLRKLSFACTCMLMQELAHTNVMKMGFQTEEFACRGI
jgi:hypothetical protein